MQVLTGSEAETGQRRMGWVRGGGGGGRGGGGGGGGGDRDREKSDLREISMALKAHWNGVKNKTKKGCSFFITPADFSTGTKIAHR